MPSFHQVTKKQTCFGSLATLFLNFLNCLSASKASFPSVARDSSSLSLSESPRSSFDFTNCLYSSNLSISLLLQAALSSVSVSITSSYSGKRTLFFFLSAVASRKPNYYHINISTYWLTVVKNLKLKDILTSEQPHKSFTVCLSNS